MKERFHRFIRANFIIWAFVLLSVLIELTGVCVTSGKFWIRRPYIFLSWLGILTCILFTVKSQRARYWCAFSFLLLGTLIDLVFIVVYDMTGSTFDFSMLNLRGDAMAIVERIPINFVFVSVSGLSISLYMLLARYYIRLAPQPKTVLPQTAVACIMAAVLFVHGGLVYMENRGKNPADLSYKLVSGNDGSYYDMGIFGNFINELYSGAFFGKVPLVDEKELDSYVYASQNTPTAMFGKANGYNVVTILAESFEWFAFMNNLESAGIENAFPGGFTVSETVLRSLYPNLYDLYDEGIVCLNHHAREKTDISENQAIIGNYPSNCYINYDYPENTVPYSLPNILNALYGMPSSSFHNGNYTFYNRGVHHEKALGFRTFTAREQMDELGSDKFTDYKARDDEYNLDSEMIEVCKEKMFPSTHRFNTFITTISMHGQYAFRKNLLPHLQTLYQNGVIETVPEENGTEKEELTPFAYYAATALELDKAVGVMMEHLTNTKNADGTRLIDNTVVVMFGDHNAYYQSLSPTVKNLYLEGTESVFETNRNYTDLFRVPMLLHLGAAIDEIPAEARKITKFTTTTDIVPTVLDLLGIRYYNSLNYGTSIFSSEESVIYSRAYNKFITDKLYFSSLNNITWQASDVTDAYIAEVKQKALSLLDKTSRVNQIFYYNFLSGARADTYYARLRALNER